jgi:hypothetical protein
MCGGGNSQPSLGARLRADARGGDGGVREELAAGIGRILINAQIAALLFYRASHIGCPKNESRCSKNASEPSLI